MGRNGALGLVLCMLALAHAPAPLATDVHPTCQMFRGHESLLGNMHQQGTLQPSQGLEQQKIKTILGDKHGSDREPEMLELTSRTTRVRQLKRRLTAQSSSLLHMRDAKSDICAVLKHALGTKYSKSEILGVDPPLEDIKADSPWTVYLKAQDATNADTCIQFDGFAKAKGAKLDFEVSNAKKFDCVNGPDFKLRSWRQVCMQFDVAILPGVELHFSLAGTVESSGKDVKVDLMVGAGVGVGALGQTLTIFFEFHVSVTFQRTKWAFDINGAIKDSLTRIGNDLLAKVPYFGANAKQRAIEEHLNKAVEEFREKELTEAAETPTVTATATTSPTTPSAAESDAAFDKKMKEVIEAVDTASEKMFWRVYNVLLKMKNEKVSKQDLFESFPELLTIAFRIVFQGLSDKDDPKKDARVHDNKPNCDAPQVVEKHLKIPCLLAQYGALLAKPDRSRFFGVGKGQFQNTVQSMPILFPEFFQKHEGSKFSWEAIRLSLNARARALTEQRQGASYLALLVAKILDTKGGLQTVLNRVAEQRETANGVRYSSMEYSATFPPSLSFGSDRIGYCSPDYNKLQASFVWSKTKTFPLGGAPTSEPWRLTTSLGVVVPVPGGGHLRVDGKYVHWKNEATTVISLVYPSILASLRPIKMLENTQADIAVTKKLLAASREMDKQGGVVQYLSNKVKKTYEILTTDHGDKVGFAAMIGSAILDGALSLTDKLKFASAEIGGRAGLVYEEVVDTTHEDWPTKSIKLSRIQETYNYAKVSTGVVGASFYASWGREVTLYATPESSEAPELSPSNSNAGSFSDDEEMRSMNAEVEREVEANTNAARECETRPASCGAEVDLARPLLEADALLEIGQNITTKANTHTERRSIESSIDEQLRTGGVKQEHTESPKSMDEDRAEEMMVFGIVDISVHEYIATLTGKSKLSAAHKELLMSDEVATEKYAQGLLKSAPKKTAKRSSGKDVSTKQQTKTATQSKASTSVAVGSLVTASKSGGPSDVYRVDTVKNGLVTLLDAGGKSSRWDVADVRALPDHAASALRFLPTLQSAISKQWPSTKANTLTPVGSKLRSSSEGINAGLLYTSAAVDKYASYAKQEKPKSLLVGVPAVSASGMKDKFGGKSMASIDSTWADVQRPADLQTLIEPTSTIKVFRIQYS